MKTNRLCAIALVFTMILSLALIAGCQQTPTTATTTATTTAATTKGTSSGTTAATTTGTTVQPIRYSFKFHTWYENVPVTSKITEMVSEKVGADISMQWVPWIDYGTKLNILNMTNELPDVVNSCGCASADVWRNVSAEITVDDFINYLPKYWEEFVKLQGGDETEAILDLKSRFSDPVNNKILGIPGCSIAYTLPFTTAWRADIVEDELGMKIPTNLEEVEAVFQAYKAKYPDKYPMYRNPGLNTAPSQIGNFVFNAYGIELNFDFPWTLVEGKLVSPFEMPNFKAALERLAKWYQLGYINPEFITIKGSEDLDAFQAGQTLVYEVASSWSTAPSKLNPNGIEANIKKNISQARLAWMGIITPTQGVEKSKPRVYSPFPGWMTKVSVNSSKDRDPDRFAALLGVLDKISSDEELYTLVQYGIEGVHYDRQADGSILPKEKYNPNTTEGQNAAFSEGIIGYNAFGTLMSCDRFLYKIMGTNYKTAWDDYATLIGWNIGTYKKDYLFDFGPALNMGNETFPQYDVLSKQYLDFITGKKTINEFDKWLADLKAAGLDAKTAAANKQKLDYFIRGLGQ